jgi:thymidine kinase
VMEYAVMVEGMRRDFKYSGNRYASYEWFCIVSQLPAIADELFETNTSCMFCCQRLLRATCMGSMHRLGDPHH